MQLKYFKNDFNQGHPLYIFKKAPCLYGCTWSGGNTCVTMGPFYYELFKLPPLNFLFHQY